MDRVYLLNDYNDSLRITIKKFHIVFCPLFFKRTEKATHSDLVFEAFCLLSQLLHFTHGDDYKQFLPVDAEKVVLK